MFNSLTQKAAVLAFCTTAAVGTLMVANQNPLEAWEVPPPKVDVECILGTDSALIKVSTSNDEPANDPKYFIDMYATVDGQAMTPAKKTVKGGEPVEFEIVLPYNYAGKGDGDIKLVWTDGHDPYNPDHRPFKLPPINDCVPPIEMNLDVEVACKPIGGPNGKSEFRFSATQVPATPEVTFVPALGTEMNDGSPVNWTATWEDPNHGPQTRTGTTDAKAMCTVTPPPPNPEPPAPTPQPVENKATAKAVCDSGAYILRTQWLSGHKVTFAPADGTELTKGQQLSVEASWHHPEGDPQQGVYAVSKIDVSVPNEDCVGLARTGSSTAPLIGTGLGLVGIGLIANQWSKRRKEERELELTNA